MKYIVILLCIAFQFFALNTLAQEPQQEKVYRAEVDKDGVQRVEITGGSYYYEPDYIIVKVNLPVEMTFKKSPGLAPHNIVIKAPDAGIDINEEMGAEPGRVRFTPAKTGKFEIYCDKKFLFFASHREKGMKGILEVVP